MHNKRSCRRKKHCNKHTRKQRRGGGFLNWFRSKPTIVSEKCNPDNVDNLITSEEIHDTYQSCCPKSFFGFKIGLLIVKRLTKISKPR